MSSANQNLPQPRTTGPFQFRLMHLAAIVTGAAILFALAVPLFRALEPQQRTAFLSIALVQFLVLGSTTAYHLVRRADVVQKAGPLLGLGYLGQIPGRRGPQIVGVVSLALFAVAQLGAAWFVATMSDNVSTFHLFLQQFQLGYFGALVLLKIMWQLPLGAIEFTQQGVIFGAIKLHPWSTVKLRPSHFAADRLVLVLKIPKYGQTTMTLQVPDEIREEVLALANNPDIAPAEAV